MPIVRRVLDDPLAIEWIRGAFHTAAIKFGIGIWGYTRMAGRPVDLRLIALSTSFTRLYDDLIDHSPEDGLDGRFEELLNGGRPAPRSTLERLMQELFLAIEAVVAPRRTDPFYADVARVHAWQVRSRRQRAGGEVSFTELTQITRGKGGWGILVLYTLGHTEVSPRERDLIEHIGAVGQMLDDQHDLLADITCGITTPATLHRVGARELGREVADLAGRLNGAFGPRRARAFRGLLFLYLAGLTMRRRTVRRRPPPVATRPWLILLGPTRQVIPASTDQDLPSEPAGRLR